MRDVLKLTGMVLRATPSGEYDKRLIVLTRERGKIVVFARGARRPSNSFMGVGRPFAFGQFSLFEGRDAYNLQGAEISNYFQELAEDMEGACYGSYFMELADYYSRENLDAAELLLLLYQSLRALVKPTIPNTLVQRVFELRIMVINGEYTEHPPKPAGDSATYAWEYVIATPIESLYTFNLSEQVFYEFRINVEINKQKYIDKSFHSLEILKTLVEK